MRKHYGSKGGGERGQSGHLAVCHLEVARCRLAASAAAMAAPLRAKQPVTHPEGPLAPINRHFIGSP